MRWMLVLKEASSSTSLTLVVKFRSSRRGDTKEDLGELMDRAQICFS
jgi:hypothetical protein